jgi:UDP-4-amino-4,6-dideoxy-N-acetyl-beta-L-altrosamine transaminase
VADGINVLPYGKQWIDDDDVQSVVRVLRSDFLTTGPEVEAFEQDLCRATGARHAVAVANGTAALHCAYGALGVQAGDEVITSPLTFSATSNMVLAVGARPVFVDVLPDTLCIDPRAVAAAITSKTKVIAPVDFAGQPAAIDELRALAKPRGIHLVEDAAHSIGSHDRGRLVGSLADLTTFSFHPVKTITTGEGGAITTDDDALATRLRDFRNHGLVRDPARLEHSGGPWYYEVQWLGFNYRLSALQCALGRSQLTKLDRFVARRRAIVTQYRDALASAELRFIDERPGVESAWHLCAVRVSAAKRHAFFEGLVRSRIMPQVHYITVPEFPLYRGLGYDPAETPIAHEASRELVSLPLYPALSDTDVERVIAAVRAVLAELR